MKNFLKWFGVAFFSLGIIVYTFCIFMEPDLWPIFAIMDSLLAFFIFLLLRKRKRKPKAKLNQQPTASYKTKAKPANITDDSTEEFFVEHMDYLQPLEHQIIPPKVEDYNDINSYRLAYEISLEALHTLKDFCYTKPEGKRYFEEMYCHCFNSRCKDFSLERNIEDGYKELISNWENYSEQFQRSSKATDFLIENGPHVRRKIIEIIQQEPGVLQKDIYSKFNPEYKNSVIRIVQALNKEKVIFREPYKNSFRLYLTPSILRTDD